ncbi:28S ribosomal protein S17, mitochondrial isoform X2 [Falco biarmicus]|uniref:28S ribosomal protein S17, mitochondrial isoform X2 n=1 Tax=Falco peregrinus TaxID=8954 RepID=UPI002479517C|nr:28S ribosomal protein S17, mitochondrial isoform X2 [Falco peregrinus]XP_056192826.1 28S ribosomal protein S17, mitochondrial isoform X2 [Falco biarmicus]
MSVPRGAVHAKWIVGKVIGTKMQKTAKVRVTRLVLDPYLLKFFNKRKTYFAHDPLQQCVVGDIVLLKALPERRSKHVKHELAEIVFKLFAPYCTVVLTSENFIKNTTTCLYNGTKVRIKTLGSLVCVVV